MRRTNEYDQPIGEAVVGWKAPALPARTALAGHWCTVAPAETGHIHGLYASIVHGRDDASWTYLPYGPFDSEAAYAEWFNRTCAGADPFFQVILSPAGEALGLAAYLRIMPESGSIEVGHIHFSTRLQRTPAATEAMYLMMRQAFELGYRRYEWKCDALNAPSRRAAIRFGFTFEGVFRQATVYKQRNRDTAWYSITDQEWPARRDAFERWLAPANFDAAGQQRQRLSDLVPRLAGS